MIVTAIALYYAVGLATLALGFFLAGESFEWPDDVLLLVCAPWLWPIMAAWGYYETFDRGI